MRTWLSTTCVAGGLLTIALGVSLARAQEDDGGTSDVAAWIRQLDDGKAEVREAAYRQLAKAGESARAALLAALGNEASPQRTRIAALLLHLDRQAAARTGADLTWAGLRGGPSRSGVVGDDLPAKQPVVAWSVPLWTQMLAEGSVIPAGDRVICLDAVGIVRSFDARNGGSQWLRTLDEKARITASAALAADRLVIPTDRGIVTLDATSGRKLWNVDASYGSYAAPAIQGRRVYSSLRNLGIRALDLDSGTPVFDRKLAPQGALLVHDDLLVTGTLDGQLLRIDPETGKNLWALDLGSAPQMGPTLVSGDVIVVFVNNRELLGIDAKAGKVLWKERMQARSKSESLSSAAGRVAVTGSDGYIRILDGRTGRLLWRRDSGMTQLGGPCMTKDRVIFGANGMITCRNAESGDYEWRMFAPSRDNATPAAWRGRLFVLYGNELRAYDPPPPTPVTPSKDE